MIEDEMYGIICGYEESERDYHERNIELENENEKLRKMAEKYIRQAYMLACEKGNLITKDIILEDARELGIEMD
jgi:hypothetical protein